MNSADTPPVVKSVGEFVQWALNIRGRWLNRHREEAERSTQRKRQWAEDEPFWKPWFRGHANESWRLRPKLYRSQQTNTATLFKFEEEMRGEFKRRGPQLANGLRLPDNDDDWEWYSLMQHYGAPTRLLDWTDGALIGLYFAVRPPKTGNPACVWILDPYRLNQLSFRRSDDCYGVALPDWVPATDYVPELFVGTKLGRSKPLAVTPSHVFPRLSSQRSHFTVFGARRDGLEELGKRNRYLLERITIPVNSITRIRFELELSGISDATIFPDLEALSRELYATWTSLFAGAGSPDLSIVANPKQSESRKIKREPN